MRLLTQREIEREIVRINAVSGETHRAYALFYAPNIADAVRMVLGARTEYDKRHDWPEGRPFSIDIEPRECSLPNGEWRMEAL